MHRIAAFLGIVFLWVFAGCLTLEQTLRISSDGTANASFVYKFPAEEEENIRAAMAQLSSLRPGHAREEGFLDEEAVRVFYAINHMELRSYRRSVSRNGEKSIHITVLSRHPESAFQSGVFGQFTLRKRSCSIVLPKDSKAWPKEVRERIVRLCKGFHAKLQIQAPARIKRTNGTQVGSDTAVWELPLDGEVGKCLLEPPERFFVEW